jgi:hypothetical protein
LAAKEELLEQQKSEISKEGVRIFKRAASFVLERIFKEL